MSECQARQKEGFRFLGAGVRGRGEPPKVVLGIELRFSTREVRTLNCSVTSLVPRIINFNVYSIDFVSC